MHIALLRFRAAGPGGAEQTLRHLAQGLSAAGHRVTVFGADQIPSQALNLGVQATYVTVPVWGGKTLRLLSFALNVRRLLQQTSVDVILSLERTLFQQVYRAGDGCHREWLARRRPFLSPAGRMGQSLSPFHRVLLWLEGRLFHDPSLRRIIANSRQVQEEISRHYQVKPDKIRVIYNGLDKNIFRPVSPEERRRLRSALGGPEAAGLVLFVGSGFARKGLPYLVKAYGALRDKNVHLWVVGKGRQEPYLRKAKEWGLERRVRFWGLQAEVAPFYQAADLLALPTIYDPCSNVVLEALGCGCPVLTTAANGAKEFILPGENGAVLAQPDAMPEWVEALRFWLERAGDPQTCQAAVEAVAPLSWEATVSQTLGILEEAAAKTV